MNQSAVVVSGSSVAVCSDSCPDSMRSIFATMASHERYSIWSRRSYRDTVAPDFYSVSITRSRGDRLTGMLCGGELCSSTR
jgi:hypothetical protein